MFLLIDTGRRGTEEVLVGVANISTVRKRKDEPLLFKMSDGEQISAPALDMDARGIARLLGNRKVMIIDLTGDDHQKKEEPTPPAVQGSPTDPNLANQTAASANPNAS